MPDRVLGHHCLCCLGSFTTKRLLGRKLAWLCSSKCIDIASVNLELDQIDCCMTAARVDMRSRI